MLEQQQSFSIMPMPSMNFDFKKLLADPWPFMTAWIIGGILTIWIPVRKWKRASQEYYDSYGYAVEYENQQRAYAIGGSTSVA